MSVQIVASKLYIIEQFKQTIGNLPNTNSADEVTKITDKLKLIFARLIDLQPKQLGIYIVDSEPIINEQIHLYYEAYKIPSGANKQVYILQNPFVNDGKYDPTKRYDLPLKPSTPLYIPIWYSLLNLFNGIKINQQYLNDPTRFDFIRTLYLMIYFTIYFVGWGTSNTGQIMKQYTESINNATYADFAVLDCRADSYTCGRAVHYTPCVKAKIIIFNTLSEYDATIDLNKKMQYKQTPPLSQALPMCEDGRIGFANTTNVIQTGVKYKFW